MSSRVAGSMLLAAGTLALWVGWPVASAVLAERSGDAAAELLYTGTAPSREGLRRLVDSREDSLGRTPRPKALRDLGMALILEAEREGGEAEARRLALEAERRLLDGLALAPGDVVAWSMVPFPALRRGDGARAIELLRAGMRLVPVAPDFALNRVAVLLRSEQPLDAELEDLLDRDLATAVERDPSGTAALLRERGVVEAALARLEPARARTLEDALEAIRRAEDAAN